MAQFSISGAQGILTPCRNNQSNQGEATSRNEQRQQGLAPIGQKFETLGLFGEGEPNTEHPPVPKEIRRRGATDDAWQCLGRIK